MMQPRRRGARRRGSGEQGQHGQVMILFALALVVIMGMVSIAIDGGYGLVQYRRAQNGADFAAVAGARLLKNLCGGGNAPSNASIQAEMQDVINQNSSDVGTNWTAVYLDGTGQPVSPAATVADAGYAPPTACGVSASVTPSWKPYLGGIATLRPGCPVGNTMCANATAKSVYNPAVGQPVGIVALDKVSPHQVLGGGTGSFNVYGTLFANSAAPYNPWTATRNGLQYNDIVDAKSNSQLILHGIMQTTGGNWPLDWCFGQTAGNIYNATPNGNPPTPDPFNNPPCSVGNVVLKYNQIVNSSPQIDDPLLPTANGGVPDPFESGGTYPGINLGLCPSEASPTVRNTIPAAVGGVTLLQPGDYTIPVNLTGSVSFADCSGAFQTDPATTSIYPGVFRFRKGLALNPTTGKIVKGNNVMIATSLAVPTPANVPGTVTGGVWTATGAAGNGAACFPVAAAETDGTNPCAGTSSLPSGPYEGVAVWGSVGTHGTGMNYSLMLGGAGTITLSPPNTSVFHGIALFQQRTVPGNFGLNAASADAATISITGIVYDASLPCYGYAFVSGACTTAANKPATDPMQIWDDGAIVHAGGILQAGVGTPTYPASARSAGSVTIYGPTIVDDFNTDGNSVITIDGRNNTYNLPGILGSGNPPVVG